MPARGLRILGFPSNDFGAQEPGTDSQIADFCKKNYGVEFDMFSKITVLGAGQAPLYKTLTSTPGFSGNIDGTLRSFSSGATARSLDASSHPLSRFRRR